MKTKPMIFNADMVKAVLDGRKMVTRRPVKPKPSRLGYDWWPSNKFGSMIRVSDFESINSDHKRDGTMDIASDACPIANIGDLIWVRETWGVVSNLFDEDGNIVEWTPDRPTLPVKELKYGKGYYTTGHVIYRADSEMRWCNDFEEEISAWHPSIHMPKAASRITLKVTDVRIERVQEITEEQAVLEGMPTDEEFQRMAIESGLSWYQKPTVWFKELWNSIYKNWSDNPYVWVIEFEVIHQNVDKYLESVGAV